MKISTLLTGLVTTVVAAGATAAASDTFRYHDFQGEGPGYVPFVDARELVLAPIAEQLQAATTLPGVTLRWNAHGTPKVLFNRRGHLSAATDGAPADIARSFLHQHAALFGLSTATIDAMEVLRVSPLHESPEFARMLRGETVSSDGVPHVVLMRQVFGDLVVGGRDGLVTVGIARDGRVAFVGSTLTRETEVQGDFALGMVDALLAAAIDVGMGLGELVAIASPRDDFNTFTSSLLDDVQRVRPRLLPVPGEGLRRVWEVTLLDSSHERGHPQAFIIHLDAETGRIWTRDNQVQHLGAHHKASYNAKASSGQFSGATPESACADRHVLVIDDGNDLLQVSATATSLEDPGAAAGAGPEPADITLNLYFGGNLVATQDLLGSPEVLVYQPGGGVPAGDYEIEVCPFNNPAPVIDYSGVYTATPAASGSALSSPAWRVFPNSPVPARFGPDEPPAGTDTREFWCWDVAGPDPRDDGDLGRDPSLCEGPELRNIASRVPWDALSNGLSTLTTHGNNASTAVSNVNFVAPDTVVIRPISPDRTYDYAFTDAWSQSACDPTVFIDPLRNFNDYEAATVNLFAMHNRMHDWSYLLGWTEVNSNLQFDNFGLTSPLRANDGELGSSQAGRVTVNGRDNANQLTLQDGIPGITNQYLWQALPGAIYPAGCVDGAYDMVIIAHEYTHATSNRMTGGPDGSLGGGHAGMMGEAWSDLAGIEYVQSYGYTPVGKESPFAMAVYTTGDPEAGIRNYAIDKSPLNFSNFEYDGNGFGSPHANSEIWGAANYQIRQALIGKYQDQFPFEDQELQTACADGLVSSQACPGNRRWLHLLYDGMLIQPAGPTMLDARDAILAADLLRYDGANLPELWDGFAYRGMGDQAFAADVNDLMPIPDFASPLRNNNAQISFQVRGTDGSTPVARIYTGHYEARITPTADTDPETEIDQTMGFVPGDYEFVVQAEGYGLQRFARSFSAGQTDTVVFELRPNLASVHRGAVATGDADSAEDLTALIDDTEATNWTSSDPVGTASEGKGEGAFVEGRQVTVQLAERSVVSDVQVSALQNGQNRFTALRSFDLLSCDASVADCSSDAGFSPWYQSPDDAFNGRFLRPKSPHLLLRRFEVPQVTATHVRMVVRDNQCTGAPDFQREAHPSGDPLNDPDCDDGFNAQLAALALPGTPVNNGLIVRAAELQVFASKAVDDVSVDPPTEEPPVSGDGSGRGGALGWLALLLMLPLLRRRRG